MSEPKLLQNAVRITEGDLYLVSTHVHDFVVHTFKDKLELHVDGGGEYAKRGGDIYELASSDRYEEYTLTSDYPFEPMIVDRLLINISEDPEARNFRPIKELTRTQIDHFLSDAVPYRLKNLTKEVLEYWQKKKD